MIQQYTPEPRMPVVVNPCVDDEPMPASATGTLFLLASGFGIGALVVLFGFLFLVGIGDLGHNAGNGRDRPQANRRQPTVPRQARRRNPRRTRPATPFRRRPVRLPLPPIRARRRAPTAGQQQK